MQAFSKDDQQVWLVIIAIAVLSLLFVPFSYLALNVDYDYTLRNVALGGSILGVVSGVLGSFAVLRRESLMGDALSHAALPGVAIAFLLAGRELGFLLIGAGVASWLGVQFIQSLVNTTRIKQDTAMGIVLTSWFAAGIALLTYIQTRPDASQAGLDAFIFGQAAAIVASDVQLIAIVGFIAFIIIFLFWKEFKLITFDPEFANANGYPIGIIQALLSTLIVVAIVLGLQLAGVILMVGMLIAPGIAARQWTQKLDQMIVLSAVFGAFAGGTGAILSAVDANVPTGPMIIIVAFILVSVSIGFAPERGLLWSTLRQRRHRKHFSEQTILRDIYKYACDHGNQTYPVPHEFIVGVKGNHAQKILYRLEGRGYLQQQDETWILTAQGAAIAKDDVQNQKLWDIYRAYGAELRLPLITEDRQKNIRDLLPKIAIEKLEQKLKGAFI